MTPRKPISRLRPLQAKKSSRVFGVLFNTDPKVVMKLKEILK